MAKPRKRTRKPPVHAGVATITMQKFASLKKLQRDDPWVVQVLYKPTKPKMEDSGVTITVESINTAAPSMDPMSPDSVPASGSFDVVVSINISDSFDDFTGTKVFFQWTIAPGLFGVTTLGPLFDLPTVTTPETITVVIPSLFIWPEGTEADFSVELLNTNNQTLGSAQTGFVLLRA